MAPLLRGQWRPRGSSSGTSTDRSPAASEVRSGSHITSQPEYLCPVDVPLQHLGGRWKLMLCFYLVQRPLRNGQLRRLIPQITQKMLTQQLRELEASGVVHREVYDELPPKVVYSIVESERAGLESVVDPLCRWGNDWVDRHGGRVLTTSLPPELIGGADGVRGAGTRDRTGP